jgi:peptidoglycan/xylan/chitin deacetylase (PgdA/CDA1 family)
VINYEEGSERSLAMGDPDQESMTEWGSYSIPDGTRNLAMESMYEYGSRVGIWRILDILDQQSVRATFHACAVAFEQNPDVARAAVAGGHEICSHGYRWEEVFRLTEEQEREHMRLAIESFERTCGKRPVGWYCRYGASVNTRRLVAEEGGFLYDSDAYNDDVPYFVEVEGKRHLVVPYTADVNDFRYWNSPGLSQASDFFEYMKESFEVLYEESAEGPRMMSIGLHPRMVGRPGRVRAIKQFIEYARQHGGVWFATREEIARAWLERT